MAKYINLDDPDVTYSHNAGNHEVYIVGSEAERIDIVRCRECKHRDTEGCVFYAAQWYAHDDDYCAYGERRADG